MGRCPADRTYYGRRRRPVHVLKTRITPVGRWDSLCGRRLDVGSPTYYRDDVVPKVATCKRCLRARADQLGVWEAGGAP
jgi:hypothetical protein